MSSLPEYFEGNAFQALEKAHEPSHILATRRALIRYRMSLNDSVAYKASSVIAQQIEAYGNGHGVLASWKQTVTTRASVYFEGRTFEIPPATLTRFMGGEDRPTRPVKPVLALTRDFLIANRFLHLEDLRVQHAHLLPAYELARVFKPYGESVFGKFSSLRDGEWLFAQIGQKQTTRLQVTRIDAGLYEVSLSKVMTGSAHRSASLARYLGWLFVAESLRCGALYKSDPPDFEHEVLQLKGISQSSIDMKLSSSLSELCLSVPDKPAQLFEHIGTYEKIEKSTKIQYTSNKFRRRRTEGGKRWSMPSKEKNTDLGGTVDDKKEMGEELLRQYVVNQENMLTNPDLAEETFDEMVRLIDAGADFNIPSERIGNMTAMHVFALHHMYWALDLAFERDDTNYLARTSDGRYPFDFITPSEIGSPTDRDVPEYAHKLFQRALEQGKSSGLTREELLGLPEDAPPLPPPSGMDDGPG